MGGKHDFQERSNGAEIKFDNVNTSSQRLMKAMCTAGTQRKDNLSKVIDYQ